MSDSTGLRCEPPLLVHLNGRAKRTSNVETPQVYLDDKLKTKVHGFICEGWIADKVPHGDIVNIEDITQYGGWRKYAEERIQNPYGLYG